MNDLSGIRYGAEITTAAQAHGLDPKLLAAVAAQETGGPGTSSGNNVVGDGGHGRGLFQIDDRSWAFAKTSAAMDPARNADVAAQILAGNLRQYGGNVKAALSAYNAGSPTATGTTTTWSDGRTLGYADSVMRHLCELGGPEGQLAAEAPSTRADVNALAAYNAAAMTSNAPPAASGPAYAPGSGLNPASLPGSTSSSSSSQFSAVRTWASMTSGQSGSGDAQAGSAADQGMADILDQGGVFGNDGGDG